VACRLFAARALEHVTPLFSAQTLVVFATPGQTFIDVLSCVVRFLACRLTRNTSPRVWCHLEARSGYRLVAVDAQSS